MPFPWFNRSEPSGDSQPPTGNLGRSFIGNTFAFHSNAQAVILDSKRDQDARIIRAKVLGRDVGLVVDYELARMVLNTGSTEGQCPRFSHRAAYKQLVGAFFTEPNILLEDEDEPSRAEHRAGWEKHMGGFLDKVDMEDLVGKIIKRHRNKWASRTDMDLYQASKDIAQELVFRVFLGIGTQDRDVYIAAMEATHTSLRGQFSLPVSFGGYVSTTYDRGLKAQATFNDLVADRVKSGDCPFLQTPSGMPHDNLVSHVSMFASSLVIKSLASYICFALIQRTRYDGPIRPLLLETERLCPPIIGVLRKVTDGQWQATDGLHVPEGWDTWLYFPMINRDRRVYGSDAIYFRPERWIEDPSLPEPLTLGQGSKRCLGQELVRRLVELILKGMDVKLDIVSGMNAGLKDFLGWESDGVHRWEAIKQLPVQRPKEPIIIRCSN